MKQKQMRKIINLVKEKWNNLKTLEKIALALFVLVVLFVSFK